MEEGKYVSLHRMIFNKCSEMIHFSDCTHFDITLEKFS